MAVERISDTNYLRLAQFYNISRRSCSDFRNMDLFLDAAAAIIIKRGVDINYRIRDEPRLCVDEAIFNGCTLLHLAIMENNLSAVNVFLSHGADISIKNSNGQAPLHTVVEIWNVRGKMRIIPLINSILTAQVNTGNSSNPTCKNGISHFHIACVFNNVEAVEFFLKAGVSVDQSVNVESPVLPGHTPLHLIARYSCLETAEILLKYGANVNLKDVKGLTPLHSLIERNVKIVDMMNLEKGWNYSEFIDEMKTNTAIIEMMMEKRGTEIFNAGLTELHVVCTMDDEYMAENNLGKNIDINAALSLDSPIFPGYTALHFAAHFNVATVVLLLRNGANILSKDAKGVTPLDMSIERHKPADVRLILSTQEIFKNIILSDGSTKLLDVIAALHTRNKFDAFLENITDINVSVPTNSPLWPGYTLLHIAVTFADRSDHFNRESDYYMDEQNNADDTYFERVQACLRCGVSPNLKDSDGRTPLHLAFRQKKKKVVLLLLDHDKQHVVGNPMDEMSLSHFHIACAVAMKPLIERFLFIGVDVNSPVKNSFQWYKTSLNLYVQTFYITIRANSTPLHIAVVFEYQEMLNLLLEHGADPYTKDVRDFTPIHLLLASKILDSREAANSLFSAKPLRDSVSSVGLTHLHIAAYTDSENAAKELLIQGSDINAQITYNKDYPEDLSFLSSFAGCTPLHLAVTRNHHGTTELLIRKGADLHIRNAEGKSPLHLVLDRHFDLIDSFVWKLKLKNNGKSPLDETGVTMLHIACAKFDADWVRSLLERGANVNARISCDTKINWAGCTPLHVLIREATVVDNDLPNFEGIVQLLLDHGANVNIADAKGSTPIHLTHKCVIPEEAQSKLPIADLLLKNHTHYSINPVSFNGLSHFHLACIRNNAELVEHFVKYGVDINQPIDPFSEFYAGYSPLHLAVVHGCKDVANTLLKYGADIAAEDSLGNTPLHAAAENDVLPVDLIELLLSAGADINVKNLRCETLLELKIKSRKLTAENVKFFSRHGCSFNVVNPITSEGFIAKAIIGEPNGIRPILNPLFRAILRTPKLNELDENGLNAIHNIVSICEPDEYDELKGEDYADAIERLLVIGCELDHQDMRGRTALHLAIKFTNFETVRGLLMLGADVNIVDESGKSPFAYYVELFEDGSPLNSKMIAIFTKHVTRMLRAGLYISDANKVTHANALEQYPLDNDVILTSEDELKMMEDHKFGRWTLRDFLEELGPVSEYPTMPLVLRQQINNFFRRSSRIRHNFPILGSLLMLQYRKSITRMKLIEPSMDAIINISKIQIPDLCLELILKNLKNHELENLIEAAPKKTPETSKRLKTNNDDE